MRTLGYVRGQNQPLPDTEIRELIRRTRDGDLTDTERIEARNRIIMSNSGWRHKLATEYLRHWTFPRPDAEDLADHSIKGELTAIRKFDVNGPVKFITYQTFCVKTSFQCMIHEQRDTVHKPAHAIKLGRQIDLLCEQTGMSEDEAFVSLKVKPALRGCVVKARAWTTSLEAHNDTDRHANKVEPFVWDVDRIDAEEQLVLLGDAIGSLEPRSRYVIEQRMDDRTLQSIARELHLTRERVRQIELRARRDIKKYMETYS
jgi:RNA polymerase sigma factor (sigma-70 family)